MYLDEKEQKKYKKPRKYSKSYCESTSCNDMGFTQRHLADLTRIVISRFAF